ncbi:MAG TPA: hypothetical protein VNG90_01175 [Candidatus Acidoferrum sp.]|nr:hypothetical protein [Candidatus Acidoferrum sp.]
MSLNHGNSQVKSCAAFLNGSRSRSVNLSHLRSLIIDYPETFFNALAEALRVKSAGGKVLLWADRLLFDSFEEFADPAVLFIVVRQAASASNEVVKELLDNDTIYIIDPDRRGPIPTEPAPREVLHERRLEEAERRRYRQESELAIQALRELAARLLPYVKVEAEACQDPAARARAIRALEVPVHDMQHVVRICGIIGLPVETLIKKLP